MDASISKLTDLNRKTPLRKAVIEFEAQQKQGKGFIEVSKQEQPPADGMRDTQMSFASSTNRQSLFSPGSTTRGQSPGGFGASQYEGNWGGKSFKLDNPETKTIEARTTRRMMSLGDRRNPGTNQSTNENYLANHPISALTQSSWRRDRDVLPALEGT